MCWDAPTYPEIILIKSLHLHFHCGGSQNLCSDCTAVKRAESSLQIYQNIYPVLLSLCQNTCFVIAATTKYFFCHTRYAKTLISMRYQTSKMQQYHIGKLILTLVKKRLGPVDINIWDRVLKHSRSPIATTPVNMKMEEVSRLGLDLV